MARPATKRGGRQECQPYQEKLPGRKPRGHGTLRQDQTRSASCPTEPERYARRHAWPTESLRRRTVAEEAATASDSDGAPHGPMTGTEPAKPFRRRKKQRR